MALDAPLAALERHCGLARGHGRFFLNAGAFIGLMVLSNALEEELYTNLPGFDYFKAVACLELATFAAAALLAERRSGLKTPRKAPLAFYAVLGASMALSQTLGKLANKYVNFTVSTIFKCSKALPTMALMVLCGKRYTLANVAAALTMALSAFCFAVGARQADADFNFLGVLLNGLYLLFQALQVALQDSALRAPVWKSRVCRGHPIILHQVISRRRRGSAGSPSTGEEPASPRHRSGVTSMAWPTRRFSMNAP